MRRARRAGVVAVVLLVMLGCASCGAGDDQARERARQYAQQQLAVDRVSVVGQRRAGACLVYDVRDPAGMGHRVVLLNQGSPPTFEPIYISQRFQMSQVRDDDDGACGMADAGLLQPGAGGNLDIVGPP